MAVPPEEIAQVRAATDIVGLIGEQVALKKSGRRWSGLCPFHGEKSPSFSVNAEEGLFYCFGCHKSGDAITFVRETQGLDFIDAVRLLADRSGITLHEDEKSTGASKDRAQLLSAMEQAVEFFHQRLLSSPDAGKARDYLRNRGYDGETVRAFKLGWAPDEWDHLAKHLKVSDEILEKTGLGFVNRRGRQQDFLRARVVFPIFDPGGRAIAVGGRILPTEPGAPLPDRPEPKYKNSPETPIYSKRRTLYGLNWAKKAIVASSEIIVCEGYTDVIAFFGADLPRAVATCGTALAEEHFAVMRNFAKRIILAYDADAAGQNATSRVYEWERKHEIDVAVCQLPAGTDPADLARKDPEALRSAVANAKPFLRFRVDRVLDQGNLETPEGRARAAEHCVAVIAEHPDELVRDQYLIDVADRCRLDVAMLRDRLAKHRSGERVISAGERRVGNRPDASDEQEAVELVEDPRDRPGLEALRLAVHRPDLLTGRLEAFLFSNDDQHKAAEALLAHENVTQAIEAAPPAAAALLRRVTVEEPTIDMEVTDPAGPVIAQLLRLLVRQRISELQLELRRGEGDVTVATKTIGELQLAIEDLGNDDAGVDAEAWLLEWFAHDSEAGDA
jgi:DNA primase